MFIISVLCAGTTYDPTYFSMLHVITVLDPKVHVGRAQLSENWIVISEPLAYDIRNFKFLVT